MYRFVVKTLVYALLPTTVNSHVSANGRPSFGMLHLVYGTNSPLISMSLVRYSLIHFLLSHMAVHHLHHLHYHRLHHLLLVHAVFHSELKTWLFGKFFPPQSFSFPTRLILWTLGPLSVFI